MAQAHSRSERILFKVHPRVFAALGADLVTNDVVAVIELVKNSYDAFATRVDVRFGDDHKHGRYIEVEDNGSGMDRATIKDVWCMVATPFRKENPVTKKGERVRRVAGEKGLGRLSAARLGHRLEMLTQSDGEPCWRVTVDWSGLASEDDLSTCGATIEEVNDRTPSRRSGTRVRVLGLKAEWSEERVTDLEENLQRLVSPFAQVHDFSIFFTAPQEEGGAIQPVQVQVAAPEFLAKPKYALRGSVGHTGTVRGKYQYTPVREGKPRSAKVDLVWSQVSSQSQDSDLSERERPGCGPFAFEIRAWDIGSADTEEIAEHFEMGKINVRKAIMAHKGISVYRDGILVLPKSEDSRDWLGLDLRRISKVGTRLSTTQIVGHVAISAEMNPGIVDTSDREGLAKNDAVSDFKEVLKAIVFQLENERDKDRLRPTDKERLSDLFEELTAEDVLAELVAIADEGSPAAEAVPMLRQFSEKLDTIRAAIKKRFTYYSRLATVGTIAQMLVHEIRNRTTAFGRLLRKVTKDLEVPEDSALRKAIDQASGAVASLEQLADTFAPLASRAFRRRERDTILEESVKRCLTFVAKEISKLHIDVQRPSTKTRVAVDPGELDAVVLNLVNNATYWLRQAKGKRRLEFRVSRVARGKRVRLTVNDSGPGVTEDSPQRVFLPGVTNKPGGIGMGLTVASELVAEYGGQMRLAQPGSLGGASFAFDLPIKT